MKKSELRFKCILGSTKRNKQMYDAIILARIKNSIREEDFVKSAMCIRIDDTWSNEVSPTYSSTITESYEDAAIPEVTFEAALEMLSSIEPDAPEFYIKPFDRVLARTNSGMVWYAKHFANIDAENSKFIETGGCFCNQIIKYEGNEQYLGTTDTPADWWECANMEPVWKTK